jgi:hypothetical protein
MAGLRLYDEYSRQEVHGIFSPDTNFTSVRAKPCSPLGTKLELTIVGLLLP